MSKIQIEMGRSSSATHHKTQSSTTLDRRYVKRPSNLAVEEAARLATKRVSSQSSARPSRLVNLRVREADLEAAQAAEAAEAARILAETNEISFYPQAVEYGTMSTTPVAEPIVPEYTNYYAPVEPQMMAPAAPEQFASPVPAPVAPEIDTATLAMNIAADYAAASLGASVKEYGKGYTKYAMPEPEQAQPAPVEPITPVSDSVDAIASAASEAIASIRVATDPGEVSEQVASLKAFADNIKANHDSREMRELSDTIDKFVSIAMKSTKVQEETADKAAVNFTPKVDRAAAKVTKSSAKIIAKTNAKAAPAKVSRPTKPAKAAAYSVAARPVKRKVSPDELRDRALEETMQAVATMENRPSTKRRQAPRKKMRARHLFLAFACAAACVAGVIYFVGKNIPDISVRVAAMQTGIQATYPSYIPRDYSLNNISSENGKITMVFTGPDNTSFTLIEEKSSWDSSALLRNYVEPTWNDEYTTTHEQGITIYMSNSNANAAWVNGGVLYKITSTGSVLTKKQVRNIVTSL